MSSSDDSARVASSDAHRAVLLAETPAAATGMRAPRGPWWTIAVAAAGLLATATFAIRSRLATERDLGAEVQAVTEGHAIAVRQALDDVGRILTALRGLFVASTEVDHVEFQRFAVAGIGERPGLLALEWAPAIPAAQRDSFLARARAMHGPDYALRQPLPDGSLVAAAPREFHAPLLFIAPARAATPGLDLASEPRRAEALMRAAKTGRPTATVPITLANAGSPTGVLMVAAVPSMVPDAARPMGWVVATLDFGALARAALAEQPDLALDVAIDDASSMPLHRQRPTAARPGEPFLGARHRAEARLRAGERELRLVAAPVAAYYAQRRTGAWIAVLLGWLVITALACGLVEAWRRWMALVERQVGERTDALRKEIARRERAQRALERARDAAEAATRTKSEFLATISHELRTPMNGLIGMASLLADSPLGREQRGYVETLRASAAVLMALIDDVLDFSKIEAGRLDLESAPFAAEEIVEQPAQLFAAQAFGKGLELTCAVDATVPPMLVGDAARLRQVVLNLVANAVKFTERGEVALRCAARPLEAGRHELRVEVTDTGIGIAPEAGARLFRPFTQADSSTTRRFGGTGLGLAICKRLVELMNGAIGFTSEPGRGSTFWFMVPLAAVEAPPSPQPPEGLRALIVEDHARTREILADLLARWGIAAEAHGDAGSALAALRAAAQASRPWPLALIDQRLGDADGIAFARSLREDPALGDLRTVVLVDRHGPGLDRALAEAGASGWLDKPVRRQRLLEALRGARAPANDVGGGPLRGVFAGRSALLVEDNPVNQRVAIAMLERLGCRVSLAGSGAEALGLLRSERFDLVLLDCQMPDMDGYSTAAELRRQESGCRRTPVIAVTAASTAGERERCLAAGMDDFLGKPFTAEQLHDCLARWLRPLPADGGARAVLDRAVLDNLAGEGGPGLVRSVLGIFLRETPNLLHALRSAAAANEREAVRRAAHRLRGSALTIGLQELGIVAGLVEAAVRAGPVPPDVLEELATAWERAHAAIEERLATT